ncbi:MAG: hypothetical protein GF353_21515 [Candidatus Lokiarchaeota archaeon]|nr:hypothetical protein [Candidatus Lokiarchaeota archaeon]
MKIVILNGSPKGSISVTMQYINYIAKKYPKHEFDIINIAEKIKAIEKNNDLFDEILNKVEGADGVIWGFPLYYMLVCSQYKRFIELIFERNAEKSFKDKYCATIATSIHFYDHTAINYIQGISDDLNMKFIGAYSAHMYDLLNEKERKKLLDFAGLYFDHIERNLQTSLQFAPINKIKFDYNSTNIVTNINKISVDNKKILLVTDSYNKESNLGKIIDTFRNLFLEEIELINIQDIDIKGGCLGCCKCGYNNECVYHGKDEFSEFWEQKILKADILVFAGSIHDRYFSSKWKMLFDRSFYKGHVPSLKGKQFGFIISGPVSQLCNLREIIHTYVEVQQSNLVDIVSDEPEDTKMIDTLLYGLAIKLIECSKIDYIPPYTFREIGGAKVFRDAIYADMRAIFQADHRYYKENNFYDFPKKTFSSRMLKVLFSITPIREKIYEGQRMQKEMIKPLKKVVDNA